MIKIIERNKLRNKKNQRIRLKNKQNLMIKYITRKIVENLINSQRIISSQMIV